MRFLVLNCRLTSHVMMAPKRKASADASQSSQGRARASKPKTTNAQPGLTKIPSFGDDRLETSRRSDSRPFNVQRFALQRNDSQPDSCTGNLTLTISNLDVKPMSMVSHSLSSNSVMTLKQSGNDVVLDNNPHSCTDLS